MSVERLSDQDLHVQSALAELRALIQQRYPSARFRVGLGDDPEGIYLTATVDVEDPEDVVDVFIDRLLELQIEEHLPVYVVPVRPPERVLEEMQAHGLHGRTGGGRVQRGAALLRP